MPLPPQRARRVVSESLHDEDRLSDFPHTDASLIAKQARSQLLDWIANFCELERGETEDQRKVMGMKRPTYHNPAKASINLALPWHSVAEEIADLNFNIVTGNLSLWQILSRPPPAELTAEDLVNKLTYLQDRFPFMPPSY